MPALPRLGARKSQTYTAGRGAVEKIVNKIRELGGCFTAIVGPVGKVIATPETGEGGAIADLAYGTASGCLRSEL
jgi:hypothetical protein